MTPLDHPTLCEGRYRLIEILGEGGMAVVYRAMDEHLRVERAVKLLAPAAARQPEARSRLETEARSMAGLAHPNVVSVYDIRQDDKELFLVMELISGGTLWEWVRGHGPMPPALAAQVMLPVLEAMQAAHRAGVIHRDLKPQNIMLDASGTPKVVDFGIAHVQDSLANTSYTRTGTVLGTWAFMAPEQRHSARQVDERSDVYGLGATLYSLLTAEPPFDLFAADQDSRLLAGIPDALAEPIRRATRYNPDERFASAAEMAEAIAAALPSLEPIPKDTPRLGSAPVASSAMGGETAGYTSDSYILNTDGPAADLIFGRRKLRSAPLEDDGADHSPELALHWKILATMGPALIAALAGGAVMLSRSDAAEAPAEPARVELAGGAIEIELVDARGLGHPPGSITAGHYHVRALFQGLETTVMAGEVSPHPGEAISLLCSAKDQRCVSQPGG